jgi:hypothetical protein
LRANEGRETKALNCKPITNLKEISELSNYCKPAVFVCTLLVVVACTLGIKNIKPTIHFKQLGRHLKMFAETFYLSKRHGRQTHKN